jgi:hypothetical protein
MSHLERLPWRAGLGVVALAVVGAAGCAPNCYDDGWLQNTNCPPQDPESAGGTSTTGTTAVETETAATESAEGGMMSADGESGSSGGPGLCPGFEAQLSFDLHTFLLLIDQSDAMQSMFDGGSRWSAVADALVAAGTGEITQRQSTTRFGATSYRGLQAGCPSLNGVPPQLDAADEILALLGMGVPAGHNPVANAVAAATGVLEADPWDGPKSLVLVLGNEPSTCVLPSPMNAIDLVATREAATDAVAATYAAGFSTMVVAVGGDVQPAFLQVLANAGRGHQPGDPDAPFYVAADDQALAAAFAEIFTPTRACSFSLEQALPLGLAPGCTVTVNGAPVSYDDPNGWSRPDEQTFELQGAACEAIQEGDATVEMVCNCDDV